LVRGLLRTKQRTGRETYKSREWVQGLAPEFYS
jgi:hypothetical protein